VSHRRIQSEKKPRRDNGSGPRPWRDTIAALSKPVINRRIKNRFIVIVPVYNAAKYIEVCLNSCYQQSYAATSIVIVDDASTDGTSNTIQLWMRGRENIIYHRNAVRTRSPVGNIALGIGLSDAEPDDILVTVDGDDWLATEDALRIVNLKYQSCNVWLTYGGYVTVHATQRICTKPVLSTAFYRRHEPYKTSHLRTFRKHLWDRIEDDDLRDVDGQYYKFAGDLAFMYPLIEMAGLDRIRMITERIYVYNNRNPINENRVSAQGIKICDRKIRALGKYSKV